MVVVRSQEGWKAVEAQSLNLYKSHDVLNQLKPRETRVAYQSFTHSVLGGDLVIVRSNVLR
jgi:hypothetical protein